jgi:hypothetical protein
MGLPNVDRCLLAIVAPTGQTVWKTDRTTAWNDLNEEGQPTSEGDHRKAFSTPLIIDVQGKPMLISSGSKAIYGYDPRTGRERWKIYHGSHTAVSRPVVGQGLVMFVTGNGKPELWAVKPDGEGDVTKSNVVWKSSNKTVCKTSPPVVVGPLLFMVSDDGPMGVGSRRGPSVGGNSGSTQNLVASITVPRADTSNWIAFFGDIDWDAPTQAVENDPVLILAIAEPSLDGNVFGLRADGAIPGVIGGKRP